MVGLSVVLNYFCKFSIKRLKKEKNNNCPCTIYMKPIHESSKLVGKAWLVLGKLVY